MNPLLLTIGSAMLVAVIAGFGIWRRAGAGKLSGRPVSGEALAGSALPAKESIDTWDVFDTLIARYCVTPNEVFNIVAERCSQPEFPQWRQEAQAQLDAVGHAYDIHGIYRKMEENGLERALSAQLLTEELAVEREQAVPIKRNIERVGERDLLVSDMYLGAAAVGDLFDHVTEGKLIRPPVVGNWGKANGAIWPVLLGKYRIATHHGDNSHSDKAMPESQGIACELTEDHGFTPWEARLYEAGEFQLALLQRECRLRNVSSWADSNSWIACGELLTLLIGYAKQVHDKFGDAPAFVFCCRGADFVAQVFRVLYPHLRTACVDLNRSLGYIGGGHDQVLDAQIPEGAVIVDVIGTGRSLHDYMVRNPGKKLRTYLLVFSDFLLREEEKKQRDEEIAQGTFDFCFNMDMLRGHIWHLEIMMQPGYDKVMGLEMEPVSGAFVKRHEVEPWNADDLRFLEFKRATVEAFVEGLRVRPVDRVMRGEGARELLWLALLNIMDNEGIRLSSPTFFDRDMQHAGQMYERIAAAKAAEIAGAEIQTQPAQ